MVPTQRPSLRLPPRASGAPGKAWDQEGGRDPTKPTLKPRMPTASGPRTRAMRMVDRRPKPFATHVPAKRTTDFLPRSP